MDLFETQHRICERCEGVQGVLTLFCSGTAQVCHNDRSVELKEQLEVEEENGDKQEEKVELGKGEANQRDAPMGMTVDSVCAQNLSHEVCGVIIKLWNKDARAVSVHVRHASVEVQVQCVNVVIGVVLGELLVVVHVIPLVVCDDAVIRHTLVLIALIP